MFLITLSYAHQSSYVKGITNFIYIIIIFVTVIALKRGSVYPWQSLSTENTHNNTNNTTSYIQLDIKIIHYCHKRANHHERPLVTLIYRLLLK